MEQLKTAICRLCLKNCVDFKAVEDYMKEVLDILLLKINLAISEEPVMCTNCTAMLLKCFDFKATCLDTHDYIVPFLDEGKISKLDLRKVYRSKHENVDIPDDHSVCGFCMGLPKRRTAVSLDNQDEDIMLEKLVEKYLPELDLSTIEEPLICAPCYESLKTCSHFVKSCLIVEEEIMEYRKLTGADVIEIADVLQLTSRNISRVEEDDRIDVISTEEKFYVNMENADEQVELKNDNFEEQKLLPNEDIEIKTDQHDFDRCLDGVVSPQPVTTKSRGRKKYLMPKGGPLETPNKHKKAHNVSKARMYLCDLCSFRTKYNKSLQSHMLTHKNSSEITMYRCDFCSFNTKCKRSLDTHILTHKDPSEVKMYRCGSCSYRSSQKGNLQRHMLTHKLSSETTMYQCDFCSHQTKYKEGLRKHKLIHKNTSEVKIYKCNSCSFHTKYKENLPMHMVSHKVSSETTMYQCDFCSHQTKYKRALLTHMMTHKSSSEITMYHCDFCTFKTKYKACLDGHILTHKDPSEVKKYGCGSCSYRTNEKRNLRRHMVTHTLSSETKRHQCTSCPYQTNHKGHLQRHMVAHE